MLNTEKVAHVITDTDIFNPDGTINTEKLSNAALKMSPLKPDSIKTSGRMEIEFGYGKVLITPIMREDKSKGAIVLQPNRGTGIVGDETSTDTFSESGNDILLTFANTESIDVLIRRLEQLKRMMNGQEDGLKESDYDF